MSLTCSIDQNSDVSNAFRRCERVSCPNYQQCQTMPLRITYYQLSFQTNIVIPAQIFRIGPSPAYSGDNIIISIPSGNEEGYFSTRKLNSFTGAVYLHRQVREPRDFLIDVEMKLLRQGTFTTFLARIYVFITATSMWYYSCLTTPLIPHGVKLFKLLPWSCLSSGRSLGFCLPNGFCSERLWWDSPTGIQPLVLSRVRTNRMEYRDWQKHLAFKSP